MRGITPIVAIVILLLMTIAAGGLAYLTITSFQSQSQAGSQSALEALSGAAKSQVKIESISGGKLYLRSLGDNCKGVIVQVGNEPGQVLGDCSGSLSVFEVNSSCTGGPQKVKVTVGGSVVTQNVPCSELGVQTGGPVPSITCGEDSYFKDPIRDAHDLRDSMQAPSEIYFGEKYHVSGTKTLTRIDFIVRGSRPAGRIDFRIGDGDIASVNPVPLPVDGSVAISAGSDDHTGNWSSVIINKPVSGDFWVIWNESSQIDLIANASSDPSAHTYACDDGSMFPVPCSANMADITAAGYVGHLNFAFIFQFGDSLCPSGSYCSSSACTGLFCGNGACDIGENITSCPSDCIVGSVCGDAYCNVTAGESCMTCPADCGCGSGSYCNSGTCSGCDLMCNGGCQSSQCQGTDPDCGSPSSPIECCGNGNCNATDGETPVTCPADCPAVCGDGILEPSETCITCPVDCNTYYLYSFSDHSTKENVTLAPSVANLSLSLNLPNKTVTSAKMNMSGWGIDPVFGFSAKTDYSTGAYPIGIVSAEFDGDLYPDVVTTNNNDDTFSYLRNHGDGTFEAKVDYPTNSRPSSIAACDVDHDGHPDLVVVNGGVAGGNNFTYFRNNGAGTFTKIADYVTDVVPEEILCVDLDKDGYPDVVVSTSSDTINVFKNHHDGTFEAKVTYATGSLPWHIAAADVDHDGYPDVVTANDYSGMFSVFKNKHDGTFYAKADYMAINWPTAIVLADIDHDGYVDVVVTSYMNSQVGVSKNNGDGMFQVPVTYFTNSMPESIASADFNLDGYADIVVGNRGSGNFSFYKNNRDGTLQAKVDYSTGTWPGAITTADVDHDGDPDVIVANAGSNTISVFRGNGAPQTHTGFAAHVDAATGGRPMEVAVADFNLDGFPDVALADQWTNNMLILKNRGNGTFYTGVGYFSGAMPQNIASADFDNDTYPDVVTSNSNTDSFSLFKNNKDGTFQAKVEYHTGSAHVGAIAAADFDNDGYPDVVVANTGVGNEPYENFTYFRNNGDATFTVMANYTTDNVPTGIAACDVDHDGYMDVVVPTYKYLTSGPGNLTIFRNNHDSTFQVLIKYSMSHPGAVYCKDFNADGYPDIVVTNPGANTFSFFRNHADGTGTFYAGIDYSTGGYPVSIASCDADKDGHLDVVVANGASDTVSFFKGNGDGTFQSRVDSSVAPNDGMIYHGVGCADFNNDGYPDVLSTTPSGSGSGLRSLLLGTHSMAQSFPHSPTLNIGESGVVDWTGPSILTQTNPQQFSGSAFVNELNSLLPTCNCIGCSLFANYPNCTITLALSSSTSGILQAEALNITYLVGKS